MSRNGRDVFGRELLIGAKIPVPQPQRDVDERDQHRDFDELRQLGELTSLVSSEAGATYLAEGYTGWPTA